MTFPGETIGTGGDKTCSDCGITPEIKVHVSGGGFYIGTWCNCGPYTRESVEYYASRELAQEAFDKGSWTPRATEFTPAVEDQIVLRAKTEYWTEFALDYADKLREERGM